MKVKVKEDFGVFFKENLAKNWILQEEYKEREMNRLMENVYVIKKELIF